MAKLTEMTSGSVGVNKFILSLKTSRSLWGLLFPKPLLVSFLSTHDSHHFLGSSPLNIPLTISKKCLFRSCCFRSNWPQTSWFHRWLISCLSGRRCADLRLQLLRLLAWNFAVIENWPRTSGEHVIKKKDDKYCEERVVITGCSDERNVE